ncbi:unannotated protein [freshwater metagenome]|uniref:Unannotated protein n=1 Tax=freshwater metagenome TaxID=449393 RepID=A0A6J7EJH3_9ZZZZ|nr:hypothetical protein [Actinomycetota bacterium]
MGNYRMGAYALIAVGLINLRYQSGQANVLTHSLIIAIPGLVIFLLTFVKSARTFLLRKETKAISAALGLLLIAYAALN